MSVPFPLRFLCASQPQLRARYWVSCTHLAAHLIEQAGPTHGLGEVRTEVGARSNPRSDPREELLHRERAERAERHLVFHRSLSRQGGGRGLCALPHNHKETPKCNFKLDDVMGGVVVRIALEP
jgi:hypothetical protein